MVDEKKKILFLRYKKITIENLPNKSLLDGLGELVNPELKPFIRNKLRRETITLLKFYKEFPIVI